MAASSVVAAAAVVVVVIIIHGRCIILLAQSAVASFQMRISRVLIERADVVDFTAAAFDADVVAVVGFWHVFALIKLFMVSNCAERAHF